MKGILKFTVAVLVTLLVTACGDSMPSASSKVLSVEAFVDVPRLDTSSSEAMKTSAQEIMSALSQEKQEKFKETLTGIYVLAQLASIGAGKSKDEMEATVSKKLNGKSAAEVFLMAKEIKNKMNEDPE